MKFKLFGLVPFLCLIMSCSLTAQVKPETQTPTQTTTQNKTESSSAQNTMPQIDPNAPYAKDKHSPAFSISSVEGKELTEKEHRKICDMMNHSYEENKKYAYCL